MSKIENILQAYEQGPKDTFKFFAFWSPPITDEQYGWVKECGYTHLLIDQKYDALFGTEKMGQAVALAEKYGLKAILNGINFLSSEHPYADNPAFEGNYVDEPLSIGDLEKLSKELAAFKEKYPDKLFHINLVQLSGRSWELYSDYYIENFLSKAVRKTVSGDTYPLREPDENGKTMASFLDYVNRIGKVAIATDSEMYFFIQTISIHGGGYGNHPARRPNIDDIRFLHYVCLSCGVKGFEHFCYMSPGRPPYTGEFWEEDIACIHPNGYRTEIWYSVQKVITEFKRFENIFLKFRWKGIIPVYGNCGCKQNANFDDLSFYIKHHSYIREISATQDLLVGCFEDDDGNIGISLVNFSDPCKKRENQIHLCLDSDEQIAETEDGYVNVIQLANGEYTAKLRPGEGRFLIVPKNKIAVIEEYNVPVVPSKAEIPPQDCLWKEDFSIGGKVDTYNIYGIGNSHFEFVEEGYPEGGNGRVVRLFSTTNKGQDWISYKFHLPDISYDENKKLVFKIWFAPASFSVSVSADHIRSENKVVEETTMDRIGRWTWFEVPLKTIRYGLTGNISEVTMCIGAGEPYGTIAYIDEILLCTL